MKTKIIITVFILMFTAVPSYAESYLQVTDSLLYQAQEKIYEAFYNSFRKGNMDKLENIEKRLRTIDRDNWIPKYWIAYANYYESIYQLKMGTKEAGRKEINEGIEVLQYIKNKNSEVYALLSMMQGFKVQFMKGTSVIELAQKAKKNAQEAVHLNKKNIRAQYVLGMNTFYTPEAFRSGEKVETALKKAISLDKANENNPYLPTWGKKQAYRLLIKYYIQKKRCSDAKKVLRKALNQYPNNYMLKRYEKALPNC